MLPACLTALSVVCPVNFSGKAGAMQVTAAIGAAMGSSYRNIVRRTAGSPRGNRSCKY